MNLTTQQITFLKDIPSNIEVDMTSGWRYHFFDCLSPQEIDLYLNLIDEDKIYLIIPVFSGSKLLSKPTLHISDPFLINCKSNPFLITRFISEQWNSSGFVFNESAIFTFSFKFKRVLLHEK